MASAIGVLIAHLILVGVGVGVAAWMMYAGVKVDLNVD